MVATHIEERTDSRARDVVAGVRAMVPWMFGVGPYGLVIGVSAAQADIPTFAGWLTGPAIFSGSAQMATIQLLDAGAAP
jgi:branched chain amino acid efflux pump